ncbi:MULTISPECIES: hypothetical protein [Neptunomonas]|uniref:Uncharacterized protein n=1 Tax=Neptunomonas marina TaxID=1815562 RepID=A0A437QA11_9GAMM|nr:MULTISPECIES: hypothetical protein [Neptunomonas]RVU31401.1 hypothetical protein EOE65_05295 [Neptunomonas marina]
MNDFTLDELNALVAICQRADAEQGSAMEQELFTRIQAAQAERQELESMDFDDCLGGACKL